MARRRFSEPRKRVNVYLNENLISRFTLFYFDAARGRADFGMLSNKINELLEKHLNEVERERKQA